MIRLWYAKYFITPMNKQFINAYYVVHLRFTENVNVFICALLHPTYLLIPTMPIIHYFVNRIVVF